jgi:hypothetical protein
VALRFADIDVVAAITECGVFDFKIHREALNLTEDSWADYIRGRMRETCIRALVRTHRIGTVFRISTAAFSSTVLR